MTWHPIRSNPPPSDRLIEVAKFPNTDPEPKTTVFIGYVGIAAPWATHWREITRETAEKMGPILSDIDTELVEL